MISNKDVDNLFAKMDIEVIGEPKIIKLINAIRNSNPDSSYIYKNGYCYKFALILRTMFEGEIWYDPVPGHVYFKYENKFYDIDGVHHKVSEHIRLLDHTEGHRPHRWKPSEPLLLRNPHFDS